MPHAPHRTRPHVRLLGLLLLPAILWVGPILPAVAQDQPDTSAAPSLPDDPQARQKLFIQGLAERGLDSALQYLLNHPPKDFEQRLALLTALADAYLPSIESPDKFDKTYQQLLDLYEQLVKDRPDYQPLVASDFSQSLLFSVLSARSRADLFVAWAVPTDAQSRLVERLASRSKALLEQAASQVANLSLLTRQPDFIEKYVNTGLWNRLKDYATVRIPYFSAWAHMYLASLPSAPRHHKPPRTPNPGLAAISSVIAEYAEQTPGFKARCHLLRGRLFLLDARPDNALEDFKTVADIQGAVEPEVRWLARLGTLMALRRSGKEKQAEQLFDKMLKEPAAQGRNGLLYRILLYDNRVRHLRRRMAAASDPDQRHRLLIESYKPYEALLADPALPDDLRQQVEAFIFDRLTTGIDPDTDPASLPPMVRLAMATRLYNQALAAGLEQADKTLLAKALQILKALVDDPQITPGTKARALQMTGACQYLTGQGGYAIQTMTILADQFPDRPEGQAGINAAVTWSEALYRAFRDDPARRKTAGDLYEQALRILLDKYASLELARDGYYMLGAYLREQERYADAVKAYQHITQDHRLYLDALYEKLVCMNALWMENRDEQLNRDIRQTVRTLQQAITSGITTLDPQRLAKLNRYNAMASLIRLNILIETSADLDSIERELDQLTQRFSGVQDLPMRIKVMKIRILQKRGQWAQAEAELKNLARQQPDKAGPLAIGVIQSLFSDIAQARVKKDSERIRQLGRIALGLADWAVAWIQGQPEWDKLSAEEKITYQLMPAKANLYAGNFQKAVEQYSAIRNQPAGRNNIEAVSGLAEAYFQLGEQLAAQAGQNPDQAPGLKQQALRFYKPASKLCEIIIESEKNKKNIYYWQAQYMLLTMVDRTTSRRPNITISKTIQRLKGDDPQLGGEPWASALRALEARHALR